MENPSSIRRLLAQTGTMLLVVLLLGYPLSMGPAVYFLETRTPERGVQIADKIDRVYRPVLSLAAKAPWLIPPLEAYLDFWQRLGRSAAQHP